MSQVVVVWCCREAECVVRERPARRGGLDVSPHRELQANGASVRHKHRSLHSRAATNYYTMNFYFWYNLADFRGGFPGLCDGVGILRGAQ